MKTKAFVYVLFVVLLGVLGALLVACGGGEETPVPTTEEPTPIPPTATPAPPTVRVGAAPEPAVVEAPGDAPKGFAVDLLGAIAEEGYVDLVWSETISTELYAGLVEERFDLVLPTGPITGAHHALADFSAPYLDAGLLVVVPEEGVVNDPGALQRRRVGVVAGSPAEAWLAETVRATVIPTDDLAAAFALLESGQADALVHPGPAAAAYVASHPRAAVRVLTPTVTTAPFRFAVDEAQPDLLADLNAGLAALRVSGRYAEICEAWFGSTDPLCITPLFTGTVTARVFYDPALASWIEPLVDEYNNEEHLVPQGATAVVSATSIYPWTFENLLSGELTPTVWLPSSSLLLPPVAAGWPERFGAPMAALRPASVARSPIVFATWAPMDELFEQFELTWSWDTLHERAGHTWGEYGHPAWGDFTIGHTHPLYDGSGMAALLTFVSNPVGGPSELAPGTAARPVVAEYLAEVGENVLTADDPAYFLDLMLDCEAGGMASLSVALVPEHLLHGRRPSCEGMPELVSILPAEGTYQNDYPYVVLNAPWVTEAQQTVALDFAAFLRSDLQQERAAELGYRALLDPAVETLPAPSVSVTQESLVAWRAAVRPADVLLLLDVTASMQEAGRLAQLQAALVELLGTLRDTDRVQLVTFGGETTYMVSELSPVEDVRDALAAQIRGLRATADATPLYDAAVAAYNDLDARGDPAHRRTVVLITDGRDEDAQGEPGPASRLREILERIQVEPEAEGLSIRFCTVAYGPDADAEALRKIAEATGGAFFEATPATIDEIIERVGVYF